MKPKRKPTKPITVYLKLPRSLQRRAAMMAAQDHVTVEEWILAAVSEHIGATEAAQGAKIHGVANTANED